jgi:type I restriction enzyme R subunit
VVDYLGLADQLRQALANYTQSGGAGTATNPHEDAIAVMIEKYEVCCDLFHGFDWSAWRAGPPLRRLQLLPAAQEHVLTQDDGKGRLAQAVAELSRAFALASASDEALGIRDDVAFFQT